MNKNKTATTGGMITWFLVIVNAVILESAYLHNQKQYWWFVITIPLLISTLVPGKRKRRPIHQAKTRPNNEDKEKQIAFHAQAEAGLTGN